MWSDHHARIVWRAAGSAAYEPATGKKPARMTPEIRHEQGSSAAGGRFASPSSERRVRLPVNGHAAKGIDSCSKTC